MVGGAPAPLARQAALAKTTDKDESTTAVGSGIAEKAAVSMDTAIGLGRSKEYHRDCCPWDYDTLA